ncbi:luciferase family oxidoreductase group 1 [Aminobacter sp. J44]|nr:luciferase family oxidoreductase group 1 [Aminobacter sp. J44]
MLPNHAPLMVAEAFGTLEAMYPRRIDLGVGRAPGTDQITAHALRRAMNASVDSFPNDVVELLHYFKPEEPGQRVRAVPGVGLNVPVWILGSSLYGAQLAAMLGLPYAFASHFAPAEMEHALALYRERFEPSEYLERPYAMLGLNVTAADTDEEAELLFSSTQQAFVNLRTGRPGKLPPPKPGYYASLGEPEKAVLAHTLSCAIVGSKETVKQGLKAFTQRTGADEVMVTAQIFDHHARVRSYEILAEAAKELEEVERVTV